MANDTEKRPPLQWPNQELDHKEDHAGGSSSTPKEKGISEASLQQTRQGSESSLNSLHPVVGRNEQSSSSSDGEHETGKASPRETRIPLQQAQDRKQENLRHNSDEQSVGGPRESQLEEAAEEDLEDTSSEQDGLPLDFSSIVKLLLHPTILPLTAAPTIGLAIFYLPRLVFDSSDEDFLPYSLTWKPTLLFLWVTTGVALFGSVRNAGKFQLGLIRWLNFLHMAVFAGAALGLIYLTVAAFSLDYFHPLPARLSLVIVAATFPLSGRRFKLMAEWPKVGSRYRSFFFFSCFPLLLLMGYSFALDQWLLPDSKRLAKFFADGSHLNNSICAPENLEECYSLLREEAILAERADAGYFYLPKHKHNIDSYFENY